MDGVLIGCLYLPNGIRLPMGSHQVVIARAAPSALLGTRGGKLRWLAPSSAAARSASSTMPATSAYDRRARYAGSCCRRIDEALVSRGAAGRSLGAYPGVHQSGSAPTNSTSVYGTIQRRGCAGTNITERMMPTMASNTGNSTATRDVEICLANRVVTRIPIDDASASTAPYFIADIANSSRNNKSSIRSGVLMQSNIERSITQRYASRKHHPTKSTARIDCVKLMLLYRLRYA